MTETYFKDSFSSIALNIIAVDDDLNDPVPDLFRNIVTSDSDEVQNDVNIPRVVRGVLFSQYSHFQHLKPITRLGTWLKLPKMSNSILGSHWKKCQRPPLTISSLME